MKNIFFVFLTLLFVTACQKTIEEKGKDLVLQAMVNGQWVVTKFNKGTTDVTADFTPYRFQFKDNLTVDAMRDGAVSASGTWNGDADTRSITSKFNNAVHPLMLLNGVWTITNNSWTFVEASQTVNGELYTLRLDKQ